MSQQIHNETCTGMYVEEQSVREKSIGTTKHPSGRGEIKCDINVGYNAIVKMFELDLKILTWLDTENNVCKN